MPLFEYVCPDCSARFETLVRGRERAACPSCGCRRPVKQHSVFAAAVSGPRAPAGPAPSSCGTCGDPAGPGACSRN